jgi:hypothetical protein
MYCCSSLSREPTRVGKHMGELFTLSLTHKNWAGHVEDKWSSLFRRVSMTKKKCFKISTPWSTKTPKSSSFSDKRTFVKFYKTFLDNYIHFCVICWCVSLWKTFTFLSNLWVKATDFHNDVLYAPLR